MSIDSPRSRPSPVALSANIRWWVCGLLFVATTLNYLDRQSLSVLKPIVGKQLGWGDADYGWINFAFQTAYAIAQPFAGRIADGIGVRWALGLGVGVWSLAAVSHALVRTVLGFALARFALGAGEAMNFPASLKAVAEWFPKRERALATGLFNSGANVGVMFGLFAVWVATQFGWPWAFVIIGLLGFLWLALWMSTYPANPDLARDGRPDDAAEDARPVTGTGVETVVRSPVSASDARRNPVSWTLILRHREAWPFLVAKFLTDPVWWFYLYWLPDYLVKHRGLDPKAAATALLIPYFAASVGSIGAGWLSSTLIRRGWPVSTARYLALGLCAACMPAGVAAGLADHLYLAVIFISLAAAGHQGWAANLYSMATDVFPSEVAGSVIGLGQTTGAIGGMLMTLLVGGVLQARQDYTPIFLWAGLMHPLGWLVFRVIAGARMPPAVMNREAETLPCVPLFIGGAIALLAGAAGAAAIAVFWPELVITAKVSGTAGGMVAAIGVALIGAVLIYAGLAKQERRWADG